MPQLTTFTQQQCQNIEKASLVFSWLSLHIHHQSQLPKDPFWEKYISKFDWEVLIKAAVQKGAERSMDDFVSLWTCNE